ncbi:23S rRNA (adenine(2030)-N(6))-methyltransferase RlmJ [Lutimaribacter marinistellae]|uniref:Ribosomal RNA large subunit methyltransferase J n=1 Tax=Lutimaribacter marinistellae TaxID=1820329 RepID=A0ABV7T9S9_9RHOB
MLSYQHIYHAGNLADMHKHALLAVALDYMTRKAKPMSYVETHAGRGLYRLDAMEAVKTGEAEAGLGRALGAGWFGADHPLTRVLEKVRAREGAAAYPGSPVIAGELLRAGDAMHLAELHPQEGAALEAAMGRYGANVHRRDGYEMAQSILPPTPRRGVVLIDPSYEIKAEYDRLPGIVAQLHRKWNVGVIMLWYPILADARHEKMVAALAARDFPGPLHHEVRFPPAREGHGMIGSGMFVVNAPWGLSDEAQRLSSLFAKL